MGEYWFRRKRIGWGLQPSSRNGWIATGVFIAVEIGISLGAAQFGRRLDPRIVAGVSIASIVAFIALILTKAEPGWWKRWGDGS